MGLPRYLSNQYKHKLETQPPEQFPYELVLRCLEVPQESIEKIYEAARSSGGTMYGFVRALHRGRYAHVQLRKFKQNVPDQLDRVLSAMYVGLVVNREGGLIPDYREVRVPRYFISTLKNFNAARENRDRYEVDLAKLVAMYKGRVYASRTFPSHLKAIIFERDNFTCQRCLRDRDRLRNLGLWLEVDHIVAVVDGGLTTFTNGMTLCCDCNKAKHHSKRYLHAAHALLL